MQFVVSINASQTPHMIFKSKILIGIIYCINNSLWTKNLSRKKPQIELINNTTVYSKVCSSFIKSLLKKFF